MKEATELNRRISLMKVASIILVMTFIFAVSGCAPEAEEPEAPVDEPADDDLREGGEAIVAVSSSPVSLDWHLQSDWPTAYSLEFMYDRLIRKDEHGNLIPGLATEWEPSDDGMAFTLQLREGVEFHDGTEFNAEAVKFNFERILDPETDSPMRAELEDIVDDVEILGEYEVRFHLKRPHYDFLPGILGGWESKMLSPTAIEKKGDDFANNPVGTGPFVFDEYVRDSHLTMKRNENYWDGAPLLDQVRVRIIPERATQIIEAETGNVDVLYAVSTDDINRIEEAGFVIDERCDVSTTHFSFNMSREPFSEFAMREAVAHSMNREAIIDRYFDGRPHLSAAGVCECSPYFDEDIPLREYDMDRAAEILEEAGWELDEDGYRYRDGEVLEAEILSSDSETDSRMNQILQEQLEELGFKTEFTSLEWGTYLDYWVEGKFDISYGRNASGMTCADVAYGGGLSPESYWALHRINLSDDPDIIQKGEELQTLIDELHETMESEQRKALSSEIQRFDHEHVLIYHLWHGVELSAINPRLEDYDFSEWMFRLENAWISE